LSPQPLNGVSIEDRINTHKRKSFDQGLRNQQAIERVAVVKRKHRQSSRVTRLNRHDGKAVLPDSAVKENFKWLVQHILADADFDCNFPVRSRADVFGVCGIFDELTRGAAQLCVAQCEPAACAYRGAASWHILLKVFQMRPGSFRNAAAAFHWRARARRLPAVGCG
jgi:hypothetical protein